jgi:hypothetical protein
MSTFDRKASAIAVVLTFALLGTQSGNAAESSKTATAESRLDCIPQIQRVALWPHGPRKKVLETPRYQTRVRLVCESEATAAAPRRVAIVPTYGPRKR